MRGQHTPMFLLPLSISFPIISDSVIDLFFSAFPSTAPSSSHYRLSNFRLQVVDIYQISILFLSLHRPDCYNWLFSACLNIIPIRKEPILLVALSGLRYFPCSCLDVVGANWRLREVRLWTSTEVSRCFVKDNEAEEWIHFVQSWFTDKGGDNRVMKIEMEKRMQENRVTAYKCLSTSCVVFDPIHSYFNSDIPTSSDHRCVINLSIVSQ